MEFRQCNNNGGGIMMGGHHDGEALRPRWTITSTLTSSDQWSNLKNNLIFVLENCI